MQETQFAEYIWLDGAVPVRQIRSKARTVSVGYEPCVEDFPEWSFDGSSTEQAEGKDSDCILKPVYFVDDPVRGVGNYLVMCEVYNPDGKTVHPSNSRAKLRAVLDAGAAEHDPWVGFEQEYTIFEGHRPLGWPEHGFPAPQGPYYCGVGPKQILGRVLAERHAEACIEAGMLFYGINAEVMPGQWEFQIGYRGIEGDEERAGALAVCDQMWIARWLIHRISEEFGYHVSLDNKPMSGDWNGAGMHTNFSTNDTRDPKKGRDAIRKAEHALSGKHKEHIAVYGHNLEARLTGKHETCDINTFKTGVADRGSSIRVPRGVDLKGCGYFEDRRPGANADPYLVAARLCATVCGVDDAMLPGVGESEKKVA
ncbi:MAG: glutamine synthetase beta-grasp domain-containing protein [Rickettsiales bacterium]